MTSDGSPRRGSPISKCTCSGHHHVPHNHKGIPTPHLLQYAKKQIAVLPTAQQRQSLVATRGDEVRVTSPNIDAADLACPTYNIKRSPLAVPGEH
jgi:hypothetical protein